MVAIQVFFRSHNNCSYCLSNLIFFFKKHKLFLIHTNTIPILLNIKDEVALSKDINHQNCMHTWNSQKLWCSKVFIGNALNAFTAISFEATANDDPRITALTLAWAVIFKMFGTIIVFAHEHIWNAHLHVCGDARLLYVYFFAPRSHKGAQGTWWWIPRCANVIRGLNSWEKKKAPQQKFTWWCCHHCSSYRGSNKRWISPKVQQCAVKWF